MFFNKFLYCFTWSSNQHLNLNIFFLFLRTFLLINSISVLKIESSTSIHWLTGRTNLLPSFWLFLVLFWMLWMLVTVCVFILFHLLVSSGCTTSLTYVRSSDQRSFVVSILLASAKFLHLYFWIYLISPPKTKTPAIRLLERKRYDIVCADKDDINWYRK